MTELCALIDETPDDEVIGFIAYTPLIGFLMRKEKEWKQLQDRIDSKSRIHFVCLNRCDLKEWHDGFIGRTSPRCNGQKICSALVNKATDLAEAILDDRTLYNDPSLRPIRKSIKDLPSYHLFFNEQRAIIVTPLFVRHVSGHDHIDMPIQMFGFETTDPWTVHMIKKDFLIATSER